MDFVAETAMSSVAEPKAARRAVASGMSPTGVEVACALTCLTSAAVKSPEAIASRRLRAAPRPSASGAVMWKASEETPVPASSA
ncbi:Uncharacterised protein [Mycobacteroides abscessus subsp. abscessus]|nr:Uncharacterised protein [Mycobacteroides abscessus subsp. abscessus]